MPPADAVKVMTDLRARRAMAHHFWAFQLGFEAHDLVFGLLDEAVNDPDITVDAFAYDFNEPDIHDRLKKLKKRLRIIIDNSPGDGTKHDSSDSPESKAAKALCSHCWQSQRSQNPLPRLATQ